MSSCQWSGPPPEWVLARHLPAGELSGPLGAKVIPFFNDHGVPISFFSQFSGDSSVWLEFSAGAPFRWHSGAARGSRV